MQTSNLIYLVRAAFCREGTISMQVDISNTAAVSVCVPQHMYVCMYVCMYVVGRKRAQRMERNLPRTYRCARYLEVPGTRYHTVLQAKTKEEGGP